VSNLKIKNKRLAGYGMRVRKAKLCDVLGFIGERPT
jgi:hypothetical protein